MQSREAVLNFFGVLSHKTQVKSSNFPPCFLKQFLNTVSVNIVFAASFLMLSLKSHLIVTQLRMANVFRVSNVRFHWLLAESNSRALPEQTATR